MTITMVFLIVSGIINVFAALYVRWLLSTMSEFSENLETLWANLAGFETHVDAIHESEMYYGDSSLQELMSHSKSLMAEIVSIKDILPTSAEYTLQEEEEEGETQDG